MEDLDMIIIFWWHYLRVIINSLAEELGTNIRTTSMLSLISSNFCFILFSNLTYI